MSYRKRIAKEHTLTLPYRTYFLNDPNICCLQEIYFRFKHAKMRNRYTLQAITKTKINLMIKIVLTRQKEIFNNGKRTNPSGRCNNDKHIYT